MTKGECIGVVYPITPPIIGQLAYEELAKGFKQIKGGYIIWMPKWSYILNLKKDPSTTITPQTRGKGGNKGGGWNGRKNKGRREIQLLVPLPRPLFTLIDLLRVGESTCIASHLPSRIWGHIGNRSRDFSQRRPGTKQLPKILPPWLFQSLGEKVFKSAEGRWKEAGEEEEDFLFLVCPLLRFDFGWASCASYSREYSWKLLRKTLGTEKAVVSPSFPATCSFHRSHKS